MSFWPGISANKQRMQFDKTNWRTSKIITLAEAEVIAVQLRTLGKKLVTVNGSLDLLHAGHLDQLEEAKKQGDILFVGINSDDSVREGKGASRPYISEEARAAMVAALTCTDYVVIIDAPYKGGVPDAILTAVKPHIHVNGFDYGPAETWLEWQTMLRFGTKGYTVPRRNLISTSDIVKKIQSSN